MNIEHDSERISLHDFNELESHSLRGFLNIKRKGIISQNLFVDSFRVADHSEGDAIFVNTSAFVGTNLTGGAISKGCP